MVLMLLPDVSNIDPIALLKAWSPFASLLSLSRAGMPFAHARRRGEVWAGHKGRSNAADAGSLKAAACSDISGKVMPIKKSQGKKGTFKSEFLHGWRFLPGSAAWTKSGQGPTVGTGVIYPPFGSFRDFHLLFISGPSYLGRAVGGGGEQLGPGRWRWTRRRPPRTPPASTSATSVENGFGRAVWVLTWSSETKSIADKTDK